MLNESLLTSPSTLGPLNLHNKIFAMDHTDADNVKVTEECHEVHNVDESDILVGQLFSSRDQAWYFYKGFAREHGFSARKGTTRLDVEGNLKKQEFCCSKEGFRVSKANTVDRQRAHTPVTRTGCKARVVVTAANTNDHWVISKSYQKHNHALCTPAMTPFMRSNRVVSKADIDEATALKEVGVGTSQVMNYLTQQARGYHNVGFTHKDLYNALQRGKANEIVDGDVDESGALHNLIWFDSTSRSDYTCFGDVIVFDTTYKDNLYGRPIMPIVGVNHHHNTIVFATAIIVDKTSQSFEIQRRKVSMGEKGNTQHVWAQAYLTGHFFANIRSTQRCESINASLAIALKHIKAYLDVIHAIEDGISRMRMNKLKADYLSSQTKPFQNTKLVELENHTAEIFTRESFRAFKMNFKGRHCTRLRKRFSPYQMNVNIIF
ncbi:hypothetical protein F3Y22_tig00001509pilonHSYRG00017 [Hibiscus syriacus]|uniref:Uncharacterized protein n=1 Tax=Hibiscus syriacus TaxID=106335 RepID=A0A6A3CXL0_HIBSY|nr:hypothetical protein F3Y22_tig00001509pilonHSYRG00017 [Hibiscus syriacus]